VFCDPHERRIRLGPRRHFNRGFYGFLFHGLMQPLLGKAFGRFVGRRVILVSLTIFGLATAALGLTFHILFVIFMFGVIAGTSFSGTSPANTGALIVKCSAQTGHRGGAKRRRCSVGGPSYYPFGRLHDPGH
jgi:MFS family permease